MYRVAIVGKSGDGKTTAFFPCPELGIEGLPPEQTVFINVAGKELPMRGAMKMYPPDKPINQGGNYIESEDCEFITQAILWIGQNRQDVKHIVIDDAGYLMGLEVISKAKNKSFDKWTDLAVNKMKVINAIRSLNKTRKDIGIYCVYHQEKAADGTMKIKTAGAMLDNNILLDGLFTIILYTEVNKDFASNKVNYSFRTHSNGGDTCKSPVGMFKEDNIPNDIGKVAKVIQEYYQG